MPSQGLLPGWTIPQWQDVDETPLPKKLTTAYHLPVELHTMAEQLRHYLATLGCELTLIFHNAKNWDNCPALTQADLMMGDRLIGEAPEYTLEQWLRCDQIWPHVWTRLRFPICRLRLTLCKFSPMKRSPRRATTSFC